MRCRPIVRQRAGGALATLGLVLLGVAAGAHPAAAQRPDAEWRTIATPHFRVHFEPQSEEVARRAAASAEWAYGELSRELVPPRGTIELVVSDDVDFSNGSTTTFPTNRIVVYALPPVDESSLRNYSDWMTLVVTHELTHVFHLDRSRGAWAALQRVFGRNPYLFPAAYEPRWMSEGIAVYYESRLTGSGRITGTAHRSIVRASALGGSSPSLGGLSTTRSSYPGGESVYIYGSLVMDELAREKGAASVPSFIERSSHALPFIYNRIARKEFGESFNTLLGAVEDSALRGVGARGSDTPLADWRPLAAGFDLIRSPRWRDGRIVFAGDRGRETPAAYEVDTAGHLRRIGRRVGVEPDVPLADGSLLTAQLEYEGPYEIRSDLYVQRGRRLERLTHGARLSEPDVRADGEIIAVQGDPGTTSLVRVSRDGRRLHPITMASLDTQWAQPRWSPRGDMIAAVELIHGGRSRIVVLDTAGSIRRIIADELGSVSAAPAWSPDGTMLFFTSDRTGTSEVYGVFMPSEPMAMSLMSNAITALTDPAPLPGTDTIARPLAAVLLGARGMTLGTGVAVVRDSNLFQGVVAPAPARGPAVLLDSAPARPYRAARQLVPRYWSPVVYTSDNALVVGATTSASDVIGRHSYIASVEASTKRNEQGGGISYAWAGLGRPVVDVGVAQGWDGAGSIVRPDGEVVGTLRRRTRLLQAGLSATRPRTRTYFAANVAGGVELRDYETDPTALLAGLDDPYFAETHRRPFALLGLVGSNVQRPSRSISAEDGVTASASGERLWDPDERRGGHTRAVGALAGYRSLDLSGYAHHVVALRVAGGWTDSEDGSELSVGGASSGALGGSGLAIGAARDFPVRGYSSGALSGTRAASATLEYRAPLTMPATGFAFLYFDRTSLSVFADAATAWCAGPARSAGNCPARTTPGTPIASVGAELVADLALAYDSPLSISVGYAQPVGALRGAGVAARGLYVAAGHAF